MPDLDGRDERARASACQECGAGLAADQRYCVSCGARRGELPGPVAGMLASMRERGTSADGVAPADGAAGSAAVLAPRPHTGPFPRLPGPQALAATLLAALAFGVLAGSLAPAPLGNLVSAPLSLFVHLPPRSSSDTGASTGNGGPSADGGTPAAQTQETITVTTPAPATSTPQSSTTPTATTPSGSGGGGNGGGGGTGSGGLLGLPPIKHVFLIVLANQGISQTFLPGSGDHYLSHTLPATGELIEDYYGVAGSSLANGEALISGQGPTALSLFDCPQYLPLAHPTHGAEGQVVGSGCVYPRSTPTIAQQLTAKKLTWRAYIDGLDTAKGALKACRHPVLGANDPNLAPQPGDPYLTARNPFVYFTSVTAVPGCVLDDLGFGQLRSDLQSAATTPTFSYIVPSPCQDGDPTPCRPGAPAGLAPADAWLRTVVSEIKRSAAYKAGGLIAITFDHAPQTGPDADANACCATPAYPNLPAPASTSTTTTGTTPTGTTPTGTTPTGTTPTGTTTTATTPTDTTTTPATPTRNGPNPGDVPGQTQPTGGGGQVGLVLLSQYVKPGTVESIDYYNHYSLLGTIEEMFGLRRLGFAGDASLPLFDSVIFNRHPKSG